MTNIEFVADMAELAEASYANLIEGNDVAAELQNARFGTGQTFSETQAAEFVGQWSVVSHRNNRGQTTVCNRGQTTVSDYLAI